MKKILVVGSLNMDMVLSVDHHPVPGETIIGDRLSYHSGGKGANQAYAVGKLGGDVRMIGCVGWDDNGMILIENLAQAGVDTTTIEIEYRKNQREWRLSMWIKRERIVLSLYQGPMHV